MADPLAGMADFPLPEAQRRALEDAIEQQQVRDSLKMYNGLVERCFRECVDSFRRKDLESSEEKCVTRCCEKFMKHSSRVGVRFAELSQAAEQQVAAAMR
mmetsp:Transcript_14492/g.43814  ORF Transcript_14492/g.43814 Transcript_14492/m.43814 type:complete len:100 (-) Transcript_14492:2048-2347(-)